jgi:hypothetical protein
MATIALSRLTSPVRATNAPSRTKPALIGLPNSAATSLAATSNTLAPGTSTGRLNNEELTTTTAPGARLGWIVVQ